MSIRQELTVVRRGSRILRPKHVTEVLSTRALHRYPPERVATNLGAFTRKQFAKAQDSPNALPVVIPAHNEARSLPATLAALARTGNALPVVVDNRSTDATPDIANLMGATVLQQPTGKKHAATKRGLEYVRHELAADEAAFIDADTLTLPGYTHAMRSRADQADTGHGVAVFGSSYRMFGESTAADVATTLTNFRDNIKREQNGDLPVPHGHTFMLRFDQAGQMEQGIMALPDDLSVSAAEGGVADDVAIFRAVVGAGAVAVGSDNPDSLVLTENRLSSFSQVWAVHKGATWEEVTSTSYAQQYGQAG